MTKSVEQSGTWNSTSSVQLTGLTPSTIYDIKVAAVNEEGVVGVYSEVIRIKTMPLCSDYSWQCVATTVVPVSVILVIITVLLLVYYCK